jgi:hypothetical protein
MAQHKQFGWATFAAPSAVWKAASWQVRELELSATRRHSSFSSKAERHVAVIDVMSGFLCLAAARSSRSEAIRR